MGSVVGQIGDLADAGERMIERLRRKAFLPESRKGLNIRFGIAEAAQLLGCSTNRIRMAEDDGRLPPAPAAETGSRLGHTVKRCSGCAKFSVRLLPPARRLTCRRSTRFRTSRVASPSRQFLPASLLYAVQGDRVLVVDCDNQTTTMTLVGFNPFLSFN